MNQQVFEATRPDDYLLRLAASDLGRSYKSLALSELRVSRGDTVLDLGCGPGTDLASFADAVGVEGVVIGLDHDPCAVARATAETERLSQVEVRQGDIHVLDLADDSIDHAHTDRVLQHVADPAAVLTETVRVLRPGGTVVLAEPDWDTLMIDYPDPSVARAYTSFVTNHVVRNACIGRQLSRLAIEGGFTIDKVVPITAVFRDAHAADKVLGLRRVTERAVSAGHLTAQEGQPWLDHLATRPFFASVTLFVTVASVPASSR
ncbi:MAG: methyltransferase domain-containing protein [Actinomycetota bacterium]|nr:methyltransferase domain-containing protein [Actinomycetota bacterium]